MQLAKEVSAIERRSRRAFCQEGGQEAFRGSGAGAGEAGAGSDCTSDREGHPVGKAESPAGAAAETKARPRRAVAKTLAAQPGKSLRDCRFPTAILIRPTQTLEPHLSLAKKTAHFNLLTTGDF